jgi:phosphohistidine phosphatase SixA
MAAITAILVMRHAEKSADPLDPDLSPDGRQRADELSKWLPKAIGSPQFLFATAPSKHSRRPIETLEPLASVTGLTIDESFADQDYGALAHTLRHSDQYHGLIVICWHHGNIPAMMHALKAADGDYANQWPRNVFDLILRLDPGPNGVPKISRIVEPF